jgi:phosphoserine phosphatase
MSEDKLIKKPNNYIIENERVVCFDVDETLIHHIQPSDIDVFNQDRVLELKYESINETYLVLINEIHRKLVKEMYHRGRYVIIWSARGHEWAEIVVKALGLENHVHMIMSKPIAYVDDVGADDFMKRIYIREEK